jgi:hypothetical protein
MKNEQKLRKALRPVIMAHMAKHPNELQEGIFSSVMDHIQKVLQNTNSQRYLDGMNALASESPEAEKLVNRIRKQEADIAKSYQSAARLNKKYS